MNRTDRFFIGLCSKTTQVMLIQIVEHDNIIVRHYLRKAKIKNTERNILKTAVDDTRWLEE